MDKEFLTQLVNLFAPEGIWAVLSLVLIFYILWRQEKRDEQLDAREKKREARQDAHDLKYQEAISKLADSFEELEEIRKILDAKLH